MTEIDKGTVTPDTIQGEVERVSSEGHPTFVDAHHTAVHEGIAATIKALSLAINSGTTTAGGQQLSLVQQRLTDIENDLTLVHGTPIPIPGPQGAKGDPGQDGTSVQVITSVSPPPYPQVGDIWINDLTQRPFMWSAGAWNPLSGQVGAPGRPGRDGNSVNSVSVAIIGSGQSPVAIYDASVGSLALRIPKGDPGPPALYQGLVATRGNLPPATLTNVSHIYGVSADKGWYWSDGAQWKLIGHWLEGKAGPEGPQGPAPLLRQGTTTTGSPGSQAIVTMSMVGSDTYEFHFTVPEGEKGAKGESGETFNPQGVVLDVTQLPPSPPRLTVLATNHPTTWLWVYDPASPAASQGPADMGPPMVAPRGWVSLGEVTGPEGPVGPVGPPGHPLVFQAFNDDLSLQTYVAAGAGGVPADHAGFFMVRDTATVFGYVRGRSPELVQLGSLMSPQSLPAGGAASQVLMKRSAHDFDFEWAAPGTLPDGFDNGDVLSWDDTNQVWVAHKPDPGVDDGDAAHTWLRWNVSTSKWEPQDALPDGNAVHDLAEWNGTAWQPTTPRGNVFFGSSAPATWRTPAEGDVWFVTAGDIPPVTTP